MNAQGIMLTAYTGPKGARPFRFFYLLHLALILPIMPSIACCCVVEFYVFPSFHVPLLDLV
jgi:hypothetical protein